MTPRRYLVVAPAAIGDAVVFCPLLKTIRANEPDAHLTVLGPQFLAPLIRLFPGIDALVDVDDSFYNEGGHWGGGTCQRL